MTNPFAQYAPAASGNPFAKFKPAAAPQEATGPSGMPAPGFMSSVNRGIASVGDAASELIFNPIDATSQFFGGPRISSTDTPFSDAMTDMGMIGGERDTGFVGRVGEGVGAAAGALLPFGAAVNAARGAGGLIGAGAQTLMSPFVRNPATAVGTELLAGAGAGAGGEGAARMFGEEWRGTGEVVGGLGAGLAPSMQPPLVNQMGRAAVKAFAPYTQAGGRIAAAERLQSLSPDPRAEADLIASAEDFGQLSPAQLSGNERFMALENTVRQNVPEIGADMAQRDAAAVERLRTEATAPAQGATPDEARAFYQQRQEQVAELLQNRAKFAQLRARERIAAIEPRMRSTEASRILREELDAADKMARDAVRALYDNVPQDASIPTANVYRAFDDIVRDTPSAQTGDIPSDARRVIEDAWGEMGIPFDGPTRAQVVTMREMAGLYQKMREIARGARAGPAPKNNLARIADNISAAILRDIKQADDPHVSQLFDEARAARRSYSETFEQGEVGRILNKTRTGDDAIDPRRALDATIGRGGSQALIAREDIQAALGDNANAEGAVSDYVNRRFTEYAVRDGVVDPAKADTFIRNNAELLDSLPNVRNRINSAVQSQRSATASGERLGDMAAGATDPRQNPAAAFADAPVSREFDGVLSQNNPAAAAALLSRKAARDTTGAATRGLKASASDWLMRQARTVVNGQETLSGNAYLRAFTDPRNRAALDKVFSPEEMTRLGIVGREMAAIETARRTGGINGDVIPLPVTSALRFVLGTMAARVGAKAGAGTSGASLRTAGMFSRRAMEIFDKLSTSQAERLIMDAMQDKDLFVALLRDGTTPKGAKNLETRLSEWLASTVGQPALPGEEQGDGGENPFGAFAPVQEGALQQSSGRVADLRNEPPPSPAPEARSPYQLATMFTGMDEKRDAAVLSGFIRSMTGKNLDPAKTAWCAAFVNSVLAASGSEGTGRLNARSFLDFGTETQNPKRGDVAVFWRESPDSWKGHVGFYAGEVTKNGQKYIRVLGGNQDDSVSEQLYPASQLLSVRRPPVIRA